MSVVLLSADPAHLRVGGDELWCDLLTIIIAIVTVIIISKIIVIIMIMAVYYHVYY